MGQPLVGVAVHETVAFGAGVILVDDRSPPLDHLALHFHRTWSRSMDDGLQAGYVVCPSLRVGELQHANEHGGNHLRVRDRVLGDACEVFLGIEVLHDHGGAAEAVHRHVEAQRCGVIQRGWREIPGVAVESEHELCEHQQARRSSQRFGFVNECNTLRAAGRSAGIQHVGAFETFGKWFVRLRCHRAFIAVVVAGGAIQHVTRDDVGGGCHHRFRLVGFVLRSDEDLRATVVDDVRQFVRGESARAAGVDQARIVATPHHFEKTRMVLQANRHVVTRFEAVACKQLAHSVGTLVELSVGE